MKRVLDLLQVMRRHIRLKASVVLVLREEPPSVVVTVGVDLGHADVPVGDGVESLHEGDGAEVVEHVGLGDDEDCPMRFDRCVHGVPEVCRHSWTGVKDRGAGAHRLLLLLLLAVHRLFLLLVVHIVLLLLLVHRLVLLLDPIVHRLLQLLDLVVEGLLLLLLLLDLVVDGLLLLLLLLAVHRLLLLLVKHRLVLLLDPVVHRLLQSESSDSRRWFEA